MPRWSLSTTTGRGVDDQILFANPIDLDEARHWIERVVGPDDARLVHDDEVVAQIIG